MARPLSSSSTSTGQSRVPTSKEQPHLDLTRSVHPRLERVVKSLVALCAVITIFTTLGILLTLLITSVSFFGEYSIWKFLTGTRWSPSIRPYEFGVLPLISGTLTIMVGSACIAVPLGVAAAVYLSEFAKPRVRAILKPLLEILAGVPTIIYGYFALVYITPALDELLLYLSDGTTELSHFNALSACIVVGIMIIPLVASISEDAMRSVPRSLRMGGYALGASKFHVILRVVIPAAFSGIVASFILAFSRAIGETMAVTLASGQTPRIVTPFNIGESLIKPIETMTAAMVDLGTGDIEGFSVAYRSLFAIGLVLFAMTFTMNILGALITSKFREKYE
jgi:phosphate transport system permease protein